MKKQLTSLLLAFTIVFPASVLAQSPTDAQRELETKKGLQLISLTCFMDCKEFDHAIIGAKGLSTAFLTYVALSFFDHETSDISKRRLSSLSDLELLNDPKRFDQYLEIWNGKYEYLEMTSEIDRGSGTPNLFVQVRRTGTSKKVTRPGSENPILRGFKGVNQMMKSFEPNMTYNASQFVFEYKGPGSQTLTLHSQQLRKVFNVLQFIPVGARGDFNQYRILANLNDALTSFDLDFMRTVFVAADADMFNDSQYPRLKQALIELQRKIPTPNEFQIYDALKQAELRRTLYFMGNQSQLQHAHEKVLRYRRTNRILIKAGWSLGVGAAIAAVVYKILEPVTYGSLQEKYNLSDDDIMHSIHEDPEQLRMILTEDSNIRRRLANAYDNIQSEIRVSKKIIRDFDQYVINNNI